MRAPLRLMLGGAFVLGTLATAGRPAAASLPRTATAPAMTMAESHGRFEGKPDLVLTSSLISAGGGAGDFQSVRLLHVLTGQHFPAELASLQTRFGAPRVAQFTRTFDAFVGLAIADAAANHIALPAPQLILERNSYVLASSLRHSGVMPDGRFDVGFMLEHLLSRPMHVRLMNRVNSDPAVGPAVNADFHIVLTAAMNDLKRLYNLPE